MNSSGIEEGKYGKKYSIRLIGFMNTYEQFDGTHECEVFATEEEHKRISGDEGERVLRNDLRELFLTQTCKGKPISKEVEYDWSDVECIIEEIGDDQKEMK